MPQVICPRCGHINPSSIERCEHCYKDLTDEEDNKNTESSLLITSHKKAGKKGPPPPISSSFSPSGSSTTLPIKMGYSSSGKSPSSSSSSGLTFPGSSSKPLLPLPSHMNRYGPPSLEGSVRDLREMQLDKPLTAFDFAGDAILAVVDWRWAVFSSVNKFSHRDKRTAYAIQIEKASGNIQVALIQGNKTAIPPEIGEYVSIWGQEKKGVVLVQSLFNHSTGVEI